MSNPLLTAFDAVPFDQIKNEHFLPAIKRLIEQTKQEIDAVVKLDAAPTFLNTVVALEQTGEALNRVSGVFYNLNGAETNPELQQIAQEVSPLLAEFKNDLLLNQGLFERVKAVYDNKKNLDLSPEDAMLLDKQYKGFARNGANLSQKDQEVLRELDANLSKLTLNFGENVLAATNAYQLHLTDKDDLKGLPESVVEMAAQMAKEKSLEGWLFTLDYPSYVPFVTYADSRKLRKEIAMAFGARSFQGDKNDNQEHVLEIAGLRHKRAQLLGYESHAHYVLEERMAKTPASVTTFLNELLEKALPAAKNEFKRLEDFAKELNGIDRLEKWDGAYYGEKLKQKLYQINDEALKPFFELNKVLEGVFTVANKLFGLEFDQVNDIPKYHSEVKTYRVTDQKGAFVSLFYADFHPREGKRGGAWMTSFKSQQIKDGQNLRPHVSIVCNFSRPTQSKPALLTFNEVTTLFHEFGHALHGMLANTQYSGLSGTSVFWDFVELPSQLLENWCYEQEALSLFAKHYESQEVIPIQLVKRLKEAATFNEGIQTVRQISFGLLDMAWHSADPSAVKSVKEFENAAFAKTKLYPDTPETCMSTAFSHIFQGGYSAGYYSYKWAEVLDADAFSYFLEKGIFNKEVATSFKETVLSQGGTIEPMQLYTSFRGKKPNPDALLKRAGLIK